MKKYFFSVFAVVLFVFCLISSGESKSGVKTFSGRVISVSDGSIELKNGYKEITVQISDAAMYLAEDGQKADTKIIKICQYVKAEYSESEGKNILEKYVVLKESDCIK